MNNQPMPEPGFTVAETEAFDRGVADGERDGQAAVNPWSSSDAYALWDAWESGASVGRKNHAFNNP